MIFINHHEILKVKNSQCFVMANYKPILDGPTTTQEEAALGGRK